MRRIRWYSKAALIVLGVLLAVTFLETGLRAAGFCIMSAQRLRNAHNQQRKNTTVILCLGESTTAGQWPKFLEEYLRQAGTRQDICVIDEGQDGTLSSLIRQRLPQLLEQYKPDIVITMVGINERNNYRLFSAPAPWEDLRVVRL